MPEEQALQRQDVLAIIDALAGIRTDLQEVIRLLNPAPEAKEDEEKKPGGAGSR